MPTQLKMYLDEETLTALKSAAERFKRRSAQQVVEELILLFLPYWEQAEQAKMNRIEKAKSHFLASDEDSIKARKLRPHSQKAASKKRK